tara:strand:- start:167 stop:361 length:195 start_codon:yes stop_codon:yes gene_type:complete
MGKDKLKNTWKQFKSDAKDSATLNMYGIRELVTLGTTKPTNKEIKAMNSVELKISKGNKNFKKK